MVRRSLRIGFCVASILVFGCDERAPRAPSGLDADPYEVLTEEALTARIAEARAAAEDSDRQVLLDFLADWCEDCREVVRLSHLEPARSVIEERYIVVYVEVGRFDRHRALIEAHDVDRIATLVVLDPDGSRVARTTLEPITGREEGLTSGRLADWLRNPS